MQNVGLKVLHAKMPPRACACSLNMQQRSTCQLPGWTGRSALGLRPDLILLQYGLRSICRRFQQFQCLNKQYMTFHVIKIHAIVFVIFLLHTIEPIFWGQPSGPCVTATCKPTLGCRHDLKVSGWPLGSLESNGSA